MDLNDGDAKYDYEKFDESEPELITKNRGKLVHFRRLGFYLIRPKKGNYEVCNEKLLMYYFIWYLTAGACFALAFAWKEIFKRLDPKNYVDCIDDYIEAAFIGVLIGILPACFSYLLREYNNNLPKILTITKELEKTDIYRKFEISEISYGEGWSDSDHNDTDDEMNKVTYNLDQKQGWIDWFVKYLPFVGILLSAIVCFILLMISFSIGIYALVSGRNSKLYDKLKKDFPSYIMSLLYPIPYFASIWFCIFFLEWQRKIHECIRQYIRKITKANTEKNSTGQTKLNEEQKMELRSIGNTLNKAQKVFILLNKKIFQKTIVIDFVLFMLLGGFCSWKVLDDHASFSYIIPLSLVIGHIYVACKWSSDLMKEYNETIEVLNEMDEEDVKPLRRELNKCPPQVLAFGGFSVNYSMMTAALAFILTCISIPGDINIFTPDETHHVHDSPANEEALNITRCIEQWVRCKDRS